MNLYRAFIDEENIKFSISEIEVVREYDTEIQTKYLFFVSANCSTYYLGNYLDKELKIGESKKLMYSKDKEKLIKWLKDERERMIKGHKSVLKKIGKFGN